MSQVFLIAKREFLARAATKATIISLVIFMVVFIGGGWALGQFTGISEANVTKVALTSQTKLFSDAFTNAPQLTANSRRFEISQTTEDKAPELVRKGEVDYAIVGSVTQPVILNDGDLSLNFRALVGQAAQGAAVIKMVQAAGVTAVQLDQEIKKVKVETRNVSEKSGEGIGSSDFNFAAYLASLIGAFLLFGTILGSGQLVAMGVVEEKSSRVVEILLATVRPSQLLLGKVLGIAFLSISQMVLLGASGVIGMQLSGVLQGFDLDLSSISAWFLVWFMLGLATYVVLYAGIGSLVDKQEDIGSLMMPLLFIQMIPLYAGMFLSMNNPASPWLRILSMVPFANCYTMPFRQVYGPVPSFDLALSIGLNLVAIPLVVWLGATLYKRGILHTGGRLGLFKALRNG